jgi:hypothetical protein
MLAGVRLVQVAIDKQAAELYTIRAPDGSNVAA